MAKFFWCGALLALGLTGVASAQEAVDVACDPQRSRLVQDVLQRQIDTIQCDRLMGAVAGADIAIADHSLESACYIVDEGYDTIRINVELQCKTGDAPPLTETVITEIHVSKIDCEIEDSGFEAARTVGETLIDSKAFLEALKNPLQETLSTGCR